MSAIRDATPGDLPALGPLVAEVQALHRAVAPERYREPTPAEIAAYLADLLDDPDVAVLVADAGATPVGYLVMRRVDTAGHTFAAPRITAHVDQLAVTAAARRGGHGRALVAACEVRARAWGAAAVTLDVQAWNAGATTFYRALAYEVASRRMARVLR